MPGEFEDENLGGEDLEGGVPEEEIEDGGIGDADDADDADDVGDDTDDAGDDEDDGQEDIRVRQARKVESEKEERLALERRKLEEDRAEYERLRRSADAEARRIAAAEEERRRVEAMTPEEKFAHNLSKSFDTIKQRQDQMEFRHTDDMDKSAYDAKVRSDPKGVHARYAARVEKFLSDQRARGVNYRREDLLHKLVGEALVNKTDKELSLQRAAGKQKINAARTRPVSGRGSETTSSGSGKKTLEQRLENVQI
jgi:hypothetical protein